MIQPSHQQWGRRQDIHRLTPFLWIALGALPGAWARYLVNLAAARWIGTTFPYGTLLVNAAGCVLVGVAGTMVTGRLVARPEVVHLVMIVGFLGSLTTFSSFAYETHLLLTGGAVMRAIANVALSLAAGLAGVRLGVLLTPKLAGLL